MFSLIISIISIALVAALAAATVYFGGAAFNKGTAGADASAFVNAGQQIAGAFTLAATDGVTATSVNSLSPNYLAQVPTYKGATLVLNPTENAGSAPADILAQSYVAVEVSSQVCTEIHNKATGETTLDAAAAYLASGLFDCQQVTGTISGMSNVAANDYVAFYKVK